MPPSANPVTIYDIEEIGNRGLVEEVRGDDWMSF
jgi:hypothetical protein